MCNFILFYLPNLINEAFGVIFLAALKTTGGLIPLSLLIYWQYHERKEILIKSKPFYEKDLLREEKNLEVVNKIIKDNSITGEFLFDMTNGIPLETKKIFWEITTRKMDIEQKIEEIKSKMFYVDNFDFMSFVKMIFDSKYLNLTNK